MFAFHIPGLNQEICVTFLPTTCHDFHRGKTNENPSKQKVKDTEQNIRTAGTHWGLTVKEARCNLTVQTRS